MSKASPDSGKTAANEVAARSREAQRVLRDNDRGGYTVPAARLYPFQWNWDSCFVALGWAAFDEARAWQEIESLFSGQWRDGMVPHIVFHREDPSYFPGPEVWQTRTSPRTSGISDPPVAASAVRRLYREAGDRAQAEAALRRLYPKLLAWHRWFHGARDPKGTGLVTILHPWESGRDNSPDWDKALERVPTEGLPDFERRDLDHVDSSQRPRKEQYDRYLSLILKFRARDYEPEAIYPASPFKMADVGTNAILLRADRDLRELAALLGRQQDLDEIEGWIARGQAGLERLWDEESGLYCSLDQLSGALTRCGTSASFLAFYAGGLPQARANRLLQCLRGWCDKVAYPVPSFDPADARFDRLRYWRGPTWAIVNYMIAEGLADCGFEAESREIGRATAALIQRQGFWEYFDPLDGRGLGGDHFTWTAAMWLAWARHHAD